MHKGFSFAELAVAVVMLALLVLVFGSSMFGCWNKHVNGNKMFVDLKQQFNVAYLETSGKVERIEIDCWKDWENSDAIQFVGNDGKVYYTHLNRVILSNK